MSQLPEQRPEFEGLQFATVKSQAIGGRADITLFAPREAAGMRDVPLVILLHGVYGSHWNWAVRGGAHRTLQRLVAAGTVPAMALAMPSDGLWGDGTAYLQHAGQNFEQWILDEVPAAVPAVLPCVSTKSPLLIAGLSMGGFGALRIGAKYSKRFRAIAGHSSVTHFNQMQQFVQQDLSRCGTKPEDHSVLETMLHNRASLPPIRFDCGTEDSLLQHNRELHQMLCQSGIKHVYEEFPGRHDWAYWQTHIEDTFRFFAAVLNEGTR